MSGPTLLDMANQVSTGTLTAGFLGGIDLNSQFVAGVIGALVGAVVGATISGVISFWLQRKEHKRAEDVLEKEHKRAETIRELEYQRAERLRAATLDQQQKAMAFSLLTKMRIIFSNILVISEHLNETKAKWDSIGQSQFVWSVHHPIVTPSPHVEFTQEERGMLYALGDLDFINEIIVFDHVYQANIHLVEELDDRHVELSREIPALMEGMVGHIELDQDQRKRFGPRLMMFEDLFFQILAKLNSDAELSVNLFMKLQEILAKKTGVNLHMQVVPKEARA